MTGKFIPQEYHNIARTLNWEAPARILGAAGPYPRNSMSNQQYGIPCPNVPREHTPEQRRRIFREKAFEIGVVVLLIIAGFSFLAWRSSRQAPPQAVRNIADATAAVERGGGKGAGQSRLFGREFASFTLPMDNFTCHIDLVGTGADAPLETAITWLTPHPGNWPPTETALQLAVNSVGQIAQALVPTAGPALIKAAATMELITAAPRPHEKGVSATSDGWKLSYFTYRSFDEAAEPQPVLVLVLQRLSAGEDESLGTMNRALFEAILRGDDIKSALRSAEAAPAAG